MIVELDGRLGHEEESSRLKDQLRDNEALLSGQVTLRFGWMAIEGWPCTAASQVARVLQQRGWRGRPRPCGPGCGLAAPDDLEPQGT